MAQPQDLPPELYAEVDSPNPNEKLLCIFVKRTQFRRDLLPAPGSLYQDFVWAVPDIVQFYKDWTFIDYSGDASGAPMKFYFMAPQPDLELDEDGKVIEAKSYLPPIEHYEPYSWPPFMVEKGTGQWMTFDLGSFISVTQLNNGTQNETAQVTDDYVLNQYSGDTLIVEERFLSPYPFAASFRAVDKPNPQALRYTGNSVLGRLINEVPACLHGPIYQPAFGAVTNRTSAGTTEIISPDTPARWWAATNHLTWRTHVCAREHTFIQSLNLYHLIAKTAYAPPLTPVIRTGY